MNKPFTYCVGETLYPVIVTYRKMKTIRFRYRDGAFYVSCPRFTSKFTIEKGLNKFGEKLIVNAAKCQPIGQDYAYLFGQKVPLSFPIGDLSFASGEKISYRNKEEFETKMKNFFKRYLESRVRFFEMRMGITPPYKVRARKMSSRYGSNSRGTHSLTFSTILYHYHPDIIDSVVVHELAHYFVFNHSKKFYDIVIKYCPYYQTLHHKLKKGIFA